MPQPITLSNTSALAANRVGEITPEQRNALMNLAGGNFTGWLGCGFAAVVMIGIVLVLGNWLETQPVLGGAVVIGVLIVSVIIAGRITRIPMLRRLAQPHIEQARGQVIWKSGDYVAEAPHRHLRSIYGRLDLPPGVYDFYYLQDTPWLLSAQSAGAEAVSDSGAPGFTSSNTNFVASELSHALQQSNGFRVSDLERNREGRLTGGQAWNLLKAMLNMLVMAGLFVVFIVAVVIGYVNKKQNDLGNLILAMLFLAGCVGAFLYTSGKDLLDALSGGVEKVEGVGTKYTYSSRGRNSHITYHYKIDNMSFEVSVAAYHALIEGVVYRAYYTPRTHTLMSIEPAT